MLFNELQEFTYYTVSISILSLRHIFKRLSYLFVYKTNLNLQTKTPGETFYLEKLMSSSSVQYNNLNLNKYMQAYILNINVKKAANIISILLLNYFYYFQAPTVNYTPIFFSLLYEVMHFSLYYYKMGEYHLRFKIFLLSSSSTAGR